MSEKPQEAREDNLLEQVFTQELEKMSAPEQTADAVEAPKDEAPPTPEQEGGEAVPPPADRKNRRSSVYLYLLVLFGAAFMMLLLAYFIQRRSNEDLQDSMNLSRKELLDQINALEEQNSTLNEKITAQREELATVYVDRAHWQEWYEEAALEADDLKDDYFSAQEELYSWESFWQLELAYQAGDYLKCGHILLRQTQVFNNLTYSTPRVVQRRYDEIVRAVIDAGILDEDYKQHLDDYSRLMDAIF